MWLRHHYTVVQAGKKAQMSRSAAYRAAESGMMPVIEDEGFLWVPKGLWEAQLERLLSGKQRSRPRRPEVRA
jgi:hypothetical protein